MSQTTAYTDTGFSGALADLSTWVQTFGWQINNGYATVVDPTKQGDVAAMVLGPTLDGQTYILIRSTAPLTPPANVAVVGPDHTGALAGVFMNDGTSPPMVVPVGEFFARFTQTETGAVWLAAQAVPALGVGLMQGLANGEINLLSPVLAQWMAGLVQAQALTQARHDVILTP